MNLEQLQSQFADPGRIDIKAGQGGRPTIHITTHTLQASISLYGGQLLSFRNGAKMTERLFLSDRARYRDGHAIKGGIPICWPWFGEDPTQRGRQAHGFARIRNWQLEGIDLLNNGEVHVVMHLQDDPGSRDIWPHPFQLSLALNLSESLDLRLTTRNTGNESFNITQAMHSYFAVGSIADTEITGLEGLGYLDKVLQFASATQTGPITFTGEVDRIYQQTRATLSITDRTRHCETTIDASGSTTTVVWNPGPKVSAAMSDLADDAYRHFVCVETANAADEVVAIPAGEQHTLGVRVRWRDNEC